MTMTAERDDALREEAIRWHVRIADGSAEDWEAFVVWLGADPAHAHAYDAVEAADAEAGLAIIAAHPLALKAANDDVASPVRRWWWGSGVAASLALAIIFGPGLIQRSDPYAVATRSGQTQTVTLASGGHIVLNGNSSITLDRENPRFANLERGEAVFTIRHDPDAPFVLQVGDERIQDVGTVFNVVRDEGGVRVAVAEGSVLYNPQSEAVTLAAGESLVDPGGNGAIVRGRIDPAAVGSWRKGRLSYTAAPLSLVAADLARTIGEKVMLDSTLKNRPFTGTITLDHDRRRLFEDLAVLLNVRAEHSADGWRLVARNRAGS